VSLPFALAGFAAIFCAGYFFVGFFALRIRTSNVLRTICAVLLSIPILLCAAPLYYLTHPEILPLTTPLLIFSLSLFYCFVWPASGKSEAAVDDM
jgi:hypothetical protein